MLDVAGAAWASAHWMGSQGRNSANQVAGQAILFHNDKSKVKEVDGMLLASEKPVAPLFNLVHLFLDISYLLTLWYRWTTLRVLYSALARSSLLILGLL